MNCALVVNLLLVLLVCHCSTLVSSKSGKLTREKEVFDSLLGPSSGYDPSIRATANGSDEATAVRVNFYVRDIFKIDEAQQSISMQITFRMQWQDDRLKFNDSKLDYLNLNHVQRVWRPDLFFANEREAHMHNVMVPNTLFRIYPTGQVLYSTRISLVLACNMNLALYPFDAHSCLLKMASYGHTTQSIILDWKVIDPVQISTRILSDHRFTLMNNKESYCTSRTSTGDYSCLSWYMNIKRNLNYHLYEFFFPTTLLVCLSWTSFWLPAKAVTARVTLGALTILSMLIFMVADKLHSPRVEIMKASDVWLNWCLTFTLAALLEYMTVNYTSACCAQQHENDHAKCNDLRVEQSPWHRWLTKFSSTLDIASRIVFPAAFVVFCSAFWIVYCKSD